MKTEDLFKIRRTCKQWSELIPVVAKDKLLEEFSEQKSHFIIFNSSNLTYDDKNKVIKLDFAQSPEFEVMHISCTPIYIWIELDIYNGQRYGDVLSLNLRWEDIENIEGKEFTSRESEFVVCLTRSDAYEEREEMSEKYVKYLRISYLKIDAFKLFKHLETQKTGSNFSGQNLFGEKIEK
ncbi:9946_t:CDS:2 [Diversispora eburnea]|uniref:9946_t:CDS:1 n=1 Tax=Diversispora eburnea TaxID=1213867 RepID=A0A9N8VC54_9GLOM|nr:9946_t:CDS:2 [Diversispora eburnea]